MKLLVLIAVCMTGLAAAANDFITDDPDSEFLTIANPFYRITMFPGHLFPVFWKNGCGQAFPDIAFCDCLIDVQTKNKYFLRLDRFAQRRIIRNAPGMITVEMTGSFCRSYEETAPDKVTAKYRWTFSRNSPAIKVDIQLERPAAKIGYELHLLEITWKDSDFKSIGPSSKIIGRPPFGFTLSGSGKNIIRTAAGNHMTSVRLEEKCLWRNNVYQCSAVLTIWGN